MALGYTQKKWHVSRNAIVDAGHFASRRHFVHGLIRVDVTEIRLYLRDQKARDGGVSLSFTGYVVKCLADTIANHHPMAHAYRTFCGTKLVIPDAVDVVCLIEHKKDGVALPHIIRKANEKTWEEISQEIRRVQNEPRESKQNSCLVNLGGYLPTCCRRIFFRVLLCRPTWMRQMMGTVVVSSIGMFGSGSFWGIGFVPFHTMGIFVGGTERLPVFAGDSDTVESREFLSLTLSFDHDIMDGAPAARFTNTFKKIMESRSCVDLV
jgi:pyruvate/2-oxoglutarate dehydrogenase complex dihydrolipoamide acyltransferase (E2) component